jgi:glycine cleavage system H protein
MDTDEPEFLQYRRELFATQLPGHFLFTPSHFWIGRLGESVWRVGLTKFGSRMLGEMVDYGFDATFGATVSTGQVIGWIEGFKGVTDIVCSVQGRFQGANPDLENDLTLVNQDPYGRGWLYAASGKPDPSCVGVEGYVKILDETIDRLRAGKAP